MKRSTRFISGKPWEAIRNIAGNRFEDDVMADSNDNTLFGTISEYMKGLHDLEDVKNDPALSGMKEAVKKMISDYHMNITGNKDNEKFIRNIFSEGTPEDNIIDEISQIKQEIVYNNVNEISAEWVKEWHEKKQRNETSSSTTDEIRDFISSSLNFDEAEPVKILNNGSKNVSGRTLFVRYASLAAAALIGAVFLIRSLLPSSNPEEIFNSYYKPFDAISPVTRSLNNNETDIYALAIGSYKTGDYERAASGFSDAVQKDISVVPPRFFLGLTQLAVENYEQAINLFTGVVNDSGEYGKEARWYLGLTYLKTGNKTKAAECFEYLAHSSGFYSDRSSKILRRLK